MKYNSIHTYILLIILFVIFAFIFLKQFPNNVVNIGNSVYSTGSAEMPGSCGNYRKGTIIADNKIINIDISDNECKRELGLSGRNSLADNAGMIFIFEKDGNYDFWMKDMNFPLDMVWISADFHIVGVEKNISPKTYDAANPKLSEIFGQNYIAQYVLELPAGYCDKNNIKVGDKIIFSKI